MLLKDLKFAWKQLKTHRSFAAIAILSTAVSIAFAAAISSVIYSVLLHPYPYDGADRMGHLVLYDKSGDRSYVQLTSRQFQFLQKSPVIDGAITYAISQMQITGSQSGESVKIRELSTNAFRYYGIHTMLGRDFAERDAQFGEAPSPVAILSYRFWKSHYGGQQNALGQTIQLNNRNYAIIGVTPQRFFSGGENDIFLPNRFSSEINATHLVDIRLRRGISQQAAEGVFQSQFQEFAHETPGHFPLSFQVRILPLVSSSIGKVTGTLHLISTAVALLLIAGCMNVAILLLARGTKRQGEFALRAAIGASRTRLLLQIFIESTLLALIGGTGGILLSLVGLPALVHWLPEGVIPPGIHVHVSLQALAFCIALSLITGLLFGLAPALKFSRADIHQVLREGSSTVSHRRVTKTLNTALIIGQVSLGLLLIISAGTALKTFIKLYQTRLNYNPDAVLTAGILLNKGEYKDWRGRVRYYDRLLSSISELPNVTSVSIAYLPIPPISNWSSDITLPEDQSVRKATLQVASSNFFKTLEITFLQGTPWSREDDLNSAHVAVANQTMARAFWPDGKVLGRYVQIANLEPKNSYGMDVDDPLYGSDSEEGKVRIIGIVKDTPNDGLQKSILPAVYVPYSIVTPNYFGLLVRTKGNPLGAVRDVQKQVSVVNADQSVSQISTADDQLAHYGWAQQRFTATLLSFLGLAGTALIAVGLYSVISYQVSQRTREFGIRITLGAGRRHIVGLVIRSVGAMLGIGLGIGLLLSIMMRDAVRHWTALQILDPLTVTLACLTLIVVSAIAISVPVWQAATIQPMKSLRSE